MLHHLLTYFGQRQPWRRYQAREHLHTWLCGSGCVYRPWRGKRGYHCETCGRGEAAHRPLWWRVAWALGFDPGSGGSDGH